MYRAIFLNLIFVALFLGAGPTEVLTLVEKSCVSCHNAKLKSGDLDLKSVAARSDTFVHEREIWEKVLEKLQTKQMPPPALPQPPAELTSSAMTWLKEEVARQDRTIKPEAGRVSARRLNRAEYNNTIRDLLGVDI